VFVQPVHDVLLYTDWGLYPSVSITMLHLLGNLI